MKLSTTQNKKRTEKNKNRRWSTVVASSWESKFLKSVFFRLDHHLTWDPHFHIENDQEIYSKFAAWLFDRQLGSIKRAFKYIAIYATIYTIIVLLSVAIEGKWVAFITIFVVNTFLIIYYSIFAKSFSQQYELRTVTSTASTIGNQDAASTLQSLAEECSTKKFNTLSNIKSIEFDEADWLFARSAIIPFICLTTIITIVDILFSD
eukprot:194238_1